jgi:hypothetical protein
MASCAPHILFSRIKPLFGVLKHLYISYDQHTIIFQKKRLPNTTSSPSQRRECRTRQQPAHYCWMVRLLSTVVGPRFLLSLNGPQPMMVVKADRCSGKTQLLCTLAAKLAEQNCKVCIVFSCKHLVQSGLQRVANLLPGAQSTDDRVRLLWGGGWVHCGKKVVDDADIFMVDEIGYMDPDVFYEARALLNPYTSAFKNQLPLLSQS